MYFNNNVFSGMADYLAEVSYLLLRFSGLIGDHSISGAFGETGLAVA